GADIAGLPLFGHRLDRSLLPGRIRLAVDLDVNAVRIPGFGEKGLRLFRLVAEGRDLLVVGMHRADMMMLGGLADTLMRDLQALLRIGCKTNSLADLRIVEGLLVALHAGDSGLRRH